VLAVPVAAQRKEVIPVVDPVDAHRVGLDPGALHLLEVAVLRDDLEADGDRHGKNLSMHGIAGSG
jgi:hypothetical protein